MATIILAILALCSVIISLRLWFSVYDISHIIERLEKRIKELERKIKDKENENEKNNYFSRH